MHIFIDEFVTKIAEYYGGTQRTGGNGRHPIAEPKRSSWR